MATTAAAAAGRDGSGGAEGGAEASGSASGSSSRPTSTASAIPQPARRPSSSSGPSALHPRKRVTSLRSAQIPADAAASIVVTDERHAPPSAIQILAARYLSNTKAGASPGPSSPGAGPSSTSSNGSSGAAPLPPSPRSHGPGDVNGMAPSSSSSSSSTSAAASRRMSTSALSLQPPGPNSIPVSPSLSSTSSHISASSTSRGQYPPLAGANRAYQQHRKRREAGSLDLAAARSGLSRSPSPRQPLESGAVLNGLGLPVPNGSEPSGVQEGEEGATSRRSSDAGLADTDPSSSAAASAETAEGDVTLQTAESTETLSAGPQLPPTPPRRGSSPTPSITSIRSIQTQTARQRRISTPASAGGHGAPSFAQPTQASEQRRLANMTQLINVLLARNAAGSTTTMDDPEHPSRGATANGPPQKNGANRPSLSGKAEHSTSTKIIQALSTELDAVRAALETTTSQLALAQKSILALERERDTLRESVHRSRTESDTLASQLQRKDRSVTDALERARRAEAESRERGRQGREWGARVRAVEDELGVERRERARAEAAYEAVAIEWKRTREGWKTELGQVKSDWESAQARDRAEMESLRARVAEVSLMGQAMAAGTGGDGSTGSDKKADQDSLAPFRRVLQGLETERIKMETWAQTHIDTLVAQLETEQAQRAVVEAGLLEVRRDLARMMRLARAGLKEEPATPSPAAGR
ncbi:hypothetical protein V8E36_005598 [Tilletia maclaganii]